MNSANSVRSEITDPSVYVSTQLNNKSEGGKNLQSMVEESQKEYA